MDIKDWFVSMDKLQARTLGFGAVVVVILTVLYEVLTATFFEAHPKQAMIVLAVLPTTAMLLISLELYKHMRIRTLMLLKDISENGG